MLALPAGLAAGAGTGYLPAYLLLGFSALSSAYTFVLVGRSVEATKARSFKEVGAWSVGVWIRSKEKSAHLPLTRRPPQS